MSPLSSKTSRSCVATSDINISSQHSFKVSVPKIPTVSIGGNDEATSFSVAPSKSASRLVPRHPFVEVSFRLRSVIMTNTGQKLFLTSSFFFSYTRTTTSFA